MGGVLQAIAAARELEEGAAVHQAIEDRRRQGRITQIAFPVGDDTVRCDECAKPTLVAPVHEGLQLIGGVGAHPAREEQVIQDQEIGLRGGLPEALTGIPWGGHELPEEGVGLGVQHPVARAHRGIGDGLGDVTLAGPGGADQERVLAFLHELQGVEIEAGALGYFRVVAPIKLLKRDPLIEPRELEVALEEARAPGVEFILQERREGLEE